MSLSKVEIVLFNEETNDIVRACRDDGQCKMAKWELGAVPQIGNTLSLGEGSLFEVTNILWDMWKWGGDINRDTYLISNADVIVFIKPAEFTGNKLFALNKKRTHDVSPPSSKIL